MRTNEQGVARLTITPRMAGIMLVKITSAKAYYTARIGVIGAFEPPVTGLAVSRAGTPSASPC